MKMFIHSDLTFSDLTFSDLTRVLIFNYCCTMLRHLREKPHSALKMSYPIGRVNDHTLDELPGNNRVGRGG